MKKKWIYHGLQILFIICIGVPIFGKATQNEQFLETFTGLGYPIYLTYILLGAYFLGFIAIFQSKFKMLKEWAYAGFTFALIGAFLSHLFTSDMAMGAWALITLLFLLGTYFLEKQIKITT